MATTMVPPEKRQTKTTRPLLTCGVCQKPGYQYTRTRGNHRYAYTVHYNEPPIRIDRHGVLRFRTCYDKGRLYNLEDMAEIAPKLKRTKVKTLRCVRCGRKGRLGKFTDRKQGGGVRYYLEHELVGGYWGNTQVKKRRRCYIKRGAETEALLKKLGLYFSS
jgi:hypothetical protein